MLPSRQLRRPATARPLPLALVVLAIVTVMAACSATRAPDGATGTSRGTAARATGSPSSSAATSTTRPPLVYVFPVQPVASCHVSYGHFHHDYPATDIFSRRPVETRS